MKFFDKLISAAQAQLKEAVPLLSGIFAAKDALSDAVVQRIHEEAQAKARAIIAQTHQTVLFTIFWQNAVLLASLVPVYFLHSAVPFYVAYAGVTVYTVYSVATSWPLIYRLLKTRSITKALAFEVQQALETELVQRSLFERKAVEWLAPGIQSLSYDVAAKLKKDVVAAATNMAVTLVLAFIAFRLFVIPYLEHKVLMM